MVVAAVWLVFMLIAGVNVLLIDWMSAGVQSEDVLIVCQQSVRQTMGWVLGVLCLMCLNCEFT